MGTTNKKLMFLYLGTMAVLVVMNLYLLYTNNARQSQIDELYLLQAQKTENNSFSKNKWGFEREGTTFSSVKHSEVQLPDDLSLYVFFTDHGCGFCIEYEVKKLNELYEIHGDNFRVYLLSHNKSYLRRLYNAKFPYQLIDPEQKLLNNNFDFGNPVAVLIDPNGIVQRIHIAEKNNEEKSDVFYQQMNSLLPFL